MGQALPGLVTAMTLVSAWIVCLDVHPALYEFQGRRPGADDILTRILGDGRRLFANHTYVKADVYFHSGFYPTIFDDRQSHQTPHMAEDAGVTEGRNTGDDANFLGETESWIDRHGRKHFPSVHTHLDQGGSRDAGHAEEKKGREHESGHAEGTAGHDDKEGEEDTSREILPWLKLASQLDPNLVESYTVGAFWLRRAGAPAEAEQFIREGLRANPNHPELLFELGRCRWDGRDAKRARNIWELAWAQWQQTEGKKSAEDQNRFMGSQILLNLARAESRLENAPRSIHWLETLLPFAASPDQIRQRIADVQKGLPFDAGKPAKAAEAKR